MYFIIIFSFYCISSKKKKFIFSFIIGTIKNVIYIYIYMYIHTVGILGSGVQHLFVFRACGPVRGPGVVRGGEILIRKNCVKIGRAHV